MIQMHGEKESNILRENLKRKKSLYHEFISIEEQSYSSWVQLLGHDKGSHSGAPHLTGVETIICSILAQIEGVELSPTESFILLSAILFHDLGKTVDKKEVDFLLKNKNLQTIFPISNPKKEKSNGVKIHHGLVSAFMLMVRQDFGFRDKTIIECIAIICASHNKEVAQKLRSQNELLDRFLDNYGKIRIGWLCALLTLGDEIDNSYHRSAPEWAKSAEETTKKDVRDKLSGCEIDFKGKVLLVHLQNDFYTSLQHNVHKRKTKKIINWIYEDLKNKSEIIQFWNEEFRQMHIDIFDAALIVKGHLLEAKNTKGKDEQKISLNNHFQLTVEPIIRQMKFERLLDSAFRLRFRSFGKAKYPWETLASEAGIEKTTEVKTIFHRLSMLSILYNEESNNALDLLLKETGPSITAKKQPISFSFVELDGEWTINFSRKTNKNVPNSNLTDNNNSLLEKLEESIKNFFNWATEIISFKKVAERMIFPRTAVKISNKELSYLLDEPNDYSGIYFPESDSPLFSSSIQRTGINLVITGPAGVGKSTLAMDLLSKGKGVVEEQKKKVLTINAYYSLEQPYASILEIAKRLNIEDSIKDFQHIFDDRQTVNIREPEYIDTYRESLKNHINCDKPIIFFPKLAPHSYGNDENSETLFWFRYRQIASLLEAARHHMLFNENEGESALLNSIVIDNLNSFSNMPLARQKVHQLFNLISWSGLLGIHIIETDSCVEQKTFQSEVEFLADIVIRLDWILEDYQYKTIEVAKSRCQQNVIGKHPFKIRRVLKQTKEDLYLKFESKLEPGFEIYPSIHTQVSKSEKEERNEALRSNEKFAINEGLKALVQKNMEEDTGITEGAFIMLLGKSGGHKLAIGMNYLHAKAEEESALIINLGQPIKYESVADNHTWWKDNPCKNKLRLKWKKNQKVSIDLYHPKIQCAENKLIEPPKGAVFVLNLHAGFLLPEEFIQIVRLFIEDVETLKIKIKRVLFNSTAHLPERFPLLNKNPLLLHSFSKMLKQREIGLMIIGVEGIGQDERLKGLISIADLKVTVHDFQDKRLPEIYQRKLATKIATTESNIRIISSDNVTGKDYSKKYGFLSVETEKFTSIVVNSINKNLKRMES